MKKKILALIFTLLLIPTLSFAETVQTRGEVLFTDEEMANGVPEYSSGVKVRHNTGFFVLLITEEKSGGTGDVDVYAQYSLDNSNWYRPYYSDMSGSISQEGNIVTALGNATRYIIFTARMANYIRIAVDPDADSVVDATLIFLENR